MQIRDGFFDRFHSCAKVDAFKAPSHLHQALKIFAANFRLTGVGTNSSEGAQSRRVTGAAGEQGVAHLIERGAIPRWKSHANGVGAVADDDGGCRWLPFQNSGGVGGDLFGSETRTSGDDRVDLISDGGA